MEILTNQQIIEIINNLTEKEIDILYRITKLIATRDSIGEGYGYCNDYKREYFNHELESLKNNGDSGSSVAYIVECGLEMFLLFKEIAD
jgi:hypothetical protein